MRVHYGTKPAAAECVANSLTPAGLEFSTTTLLRLGIVLIGIRLSVFDVMRLGLAGLPVVLSAIATGLTFVTWLKPADGPAAAPGHAGGSRHQHLRRHGHRVHRSCARERRVAWPRDLDY